MIPYLLLLGFVMFWIFLEDKSLNRKAFWVPLFLLGSFAGIRGYTVGSDTPSYVSKFINEIDPQYFDYIEEDREYGYQFFEYILLNFTHNYFWLLFISSIIVVYSYLIFFKTHSKDYFLSVFIFLTFNFYTFFFNGLRQGMGMAISVLATPYLIERRFFKFVSIIFFASLFHKSALIMVLFYFIVNFKIKLEYKMIGIFLCSLGLSGLVVQYLGSVNDRYSSYAETSENAGGYLTLGLYLIIGLFIYVCMKKYKIYENYFIKLVHLYLCGVIFIIPVAMLGASASGPQRLLYYFVWPVAVLIPYIFNRINNQYLYILFFLLAIIYFYIFTSNYANLTPYSLNENFRIF